MTVASPKCKTLTGDEASLKYPKTKLTEVLLYCMVCITCVTNKIEFNYIHDSGYLQSSVTITQFITVLLNT